MFIKNQIKEKGSKIQSTISMIILSSSLVWTPCLKLLEYDKI